MHGRLIRTYRLRACLFCRCLLLFRGRLLAFRWHLLLCGWLFLLGSGLCLRLRAQLTELSALRLLASYVRTGQDSEWTFALFLLGLAFFFFDETFDAGALRFFAPPPLRAARGTSSSDDDIGRRPVPAGCRRGWPGRHRYCSFGMGCPRKFSITVFFTRSSCSRLRISR
eukprot:COSAG01_NODE_683_length_14253_cov_33.540837_1_plen_169_part_00